jgi:hypothetical protein
MIVRQLARGIRSLFGSRLGAAGETSRPGGVGARRRATRPSSSPEARRTSCSTTQRSRNQALAEDELQLRLVLSGAADSPIYAMIVRQLARGIRSHIPARRRRREAEGDAAEFLAGGAPHELLDDAAVASRPSRARAPASWRSNAANA